MSLMLSVNLGYMKDENCGEYKRERKGRKKSMSSVSSLMGMAYPYMNPYLNQIQNSNLSNYGFINGLYGSGYGNIIQPTSIANAESFAKVLEKISERGNSGKETKTITQQTENSKEEKAQNTIPMTMVSRTIPRINVATGIEHMGVKKLNPYVTISYKK